MKRPDIFLSEKVFWSNAFRETKIVIHISSGILNLFTKIYLQWFVPFLYWAKRCVLFQIISQMFNVWELNYVNCDWVVIKSWLLVFLSVVFICKILVRCKLFLRGWVWPRWFFLLKSALIHFIAPHYENPFVFAYIVAGLWQVCDMQKRDRVLADIVCYQFFCVQLLCFGISNFDIPLRTCVFFFVMIICKPSTVLFYSCDVQLKRCVKNESCR